MPAVDSGISKKDLLEVIRIVKTATGTNNAKAKAISNINRGINVLVALVGKLDPDEVKDAKRTLRDWLTRLTGAGVRDLYVVFSLADPLSEMPFLIVPLGPGVDAHAVRGVEP